MPVVSLTLEETNRTILSGAYYKIIQDIVDAIKIPYGALVVLHRDNESTITDNRSNATSPKGSNLPTTVSKKRVVVTINENYNEDEITTTPINQPSAVPIFEDRDISVSVYPVYVKSDIVLDFTYMSPSRTEAYRIRDDMRLRLSQMRNILIHDVNYSIMIPTIVEDFIADVYDLKKRLEPQPLEDYFRSHASNSIYPITDMSNEGNMQLAVNESQCRIVGIFDINSIPDKIEHDNDTNNYKVSFQYKLSIDVPRAMVMRYPVMICNRPLPAKYLEFIANSKHYSKEEHKKKFNYVGSMTALSYFESHRQLENRVDINLPINVPDFDQFTLRQGHKGYALIVSLLVQVDETDNKGLLNLRDIDPYQIPDLLLNYIKTSERNYVTSPYSSFIYFGLHQEGRHFDNSILSIDENLNVSSTIPLSLYKPVRVTISMIIDITMLSQLALERLQANTDMYYLFLNEYINTVNNYKTEQYRTIANDNNFYRYVIVYIETLLHTNDYATISNIIRILSTDDYLSKTFAKLLTDGFPDLYQTLILNNIVRIDTSNYSFIDISIPGNDVITGSGVPRSLDPLTINYNNALKESQNLIKNASGKRFDIETRVMKTVMSDYVIANRKQP